MNRLRSLAAAQTLPIRGDVAANVEQHVRLVRAAAAEHAEVLVFPELSLTGYELNLGRELAFFAADPRLQPLREAAARHSMILIVGAPVRLESQFFIGAFIISPDGSLELYTKHHLGAFRPEASPDGIVPPPEGSVFIPGSLNPLVHFSGHVGAVSVCKDSLHRSHPQQAADLGAKNYFSSQFGIPAHLEYKIAKLKEAAVDHAMTIVLANFGGPTGGLPSGGGSGIWSDHGELLVQLPPQGLGVAVAIEEPSGWRVKALTL